MTSPQTAVPTTFGTIGLMQRQVRQLLNASLLADVGDDRPVAFYLAGCRFGPLPEAMDCWTWMYVEQDSPHDAVLVLAAADGAQGLYLAVNLNERHCQRPRNCTT
jgi:hypothetical protein